MAFFNGKLPWSDLNDHSPTDRRKIKRMKMHPNKYPYIFPEYFEALRTRDFENDDDYEHLKRLFRNFASAHRIKVDDDPVFEWTKKISINKACPHPFCQPWTAVEFSHRPPSSILDNWSPRAFATESVCYSQHLQSLSAVFSRLSGLSRIIKRSRSAIFAALISIMIYHFLFCLAHEAAAVGMVLVQ